MNPIISAQISRTQAMARTSGGTVFRPQPRRCRSLGPLVPPNRAGDVLLSEAHRGIGAQRGRGPHAGLRLLPRGLRDILAYRPGTEVGTAENRLQTIGRKAGDLIVRIHEAIELLEVVTRENALEVLHVNIAASLADSLDEVSELVEDLGDSAPAPKSGPGSRPPRQCAIDVLRSMMHISAKLTDTVRKATSLIREVPRQQQRAGIVAAAAIEVAADVRALSDALKAWRNTLPSAEEGE